MFGIKKLQSDLVETRHTVSIMKSLICQIERYQKEDNKEIFKYFESQKLDLSKINSRFHDLGVKIEKSHNYIEILQKAASENSAISRELLEKVTTNEAILCHIKELNEKLTFLFDYMKQLEKLLGNVELIVDQCLPELTIKLPKAKKTSK